MGVLAVALLVPSLRARAASSCSVVGVTGLNFGAYDALSKSPTVQAGSITLKCQSGGIPIMPVTVELSTGNSGTHAFRQLRKGTESLKYNLHLDPTNAQVWGNGTGGSLPFGPLIPADNVETTLPIYGRILSGQNVTAGAYTDTIMATINF
ncbi:MAG TPA: spore coat U domain-containing protein [Thermoanaerobaculia bacterium]|jgi:spore coat protein U-like protein